MTAAGTSEGTGRSVRDYHAGISAPERRQVLEHLADLVRDLVPDAVEGMSYAMPAFLYRGKGLLAAMDTRKHLAIYPYSGSVLPELADRLAGFDWAPGTLRFQPDAPPDDELVIDIVERRRAQIDDALDRPRRG